jgi:hypothetical protein
MRSRISPPLRYLDGARFEDDLVVFLHRDDVRDAFLRGAGMRWDRAPRHRRCRAGNPHPVPVPRSVDVSTRRAAPGPPCGPGCGETSGSSVICPSWSAESARRPAMARTDQPCGQVRHRARREIGALASEERDGEGLDRCADRASPAAARAGAHRFWIERREEARGSASGIGRFRNDAPRARRPRAGRRPALRSPVEFVLSGALRGDQRDGRVAEGQGPASQLDKRGKPRLDRAGPTGARTPRPMGQSISPSALRAARRR